MTDSKDIVQRLRLNTPCFDAEGNKRKLCGQDGGTCPECRKKQDAADLIEAQAAEIERMKASQQMMIETSLALGQQNKVMEKALIRLRDCDWVITLPDRMDAVREIARKALEQ